MLIVAALGGNAISDPRKHETTQSQMRNIAQAMHELKPLTRHRLVLTHGNGSEIGALLQTRQSLDTLGAMTQGWLGYWIAQAAERAFRKRAVAVVTRVLISARDSAFKRPAKPIGPYHAKKLFPAMMHDRHGWRRVVPSPKPVRIIDIDAIKKLVSSGAIAVACGGGGIPVCKKGTRLEGVEAVIDKDRASALLAKALHADMLLILTDVPCAYLNYGTKEQREIRRVTRQTAQQYINEGHFAEGSMLPKIEACIDFVSADGTKAVITDFSSVQKALKGKAGTTICR